MKQMKKIEEKEERFWTVIFYEDINMKTLFFICWITCITYFSIKY